MVPKCQICGLPASAARGKYLRVRGALACGACAGKESGNSVEIFLRRLFSRARVQRPQAGPSELARPKRTAREPARFADE